MSILDFARQARAASIPLAAATADRRNDALRAIATALRAHQPELTQANRLDLDAAEAADLPKALRKRLVLDDAKLAGVVDGLESLAALPDPIGHILTRTELADGLELTRVSCPIGVIGIIFEARPDALVQISALCLKSGNAVLLKGGSEALHTNRALARVIADATAEAGLPDHWLQLLESRSEVTEMLALDHFIDLIIPRGSNAFVQYIQQHTTIPVLGHSAGICHLYIDAEADAAMAAKVAVDAKTQYPSACNAIETILVHRDAAPALLPRVAKALADANVEVRACERCRAILPDLVPASPEDWDTEYLDLVVSVKIVDSLQEAIDHINLHGSNHTDAIVTENADNAAIFQRLVDSADVYWNASTRFADGFRYGLGAEVGISTSKIHARGPVGLEGLTIYKWLLKGHGDIVADFANGTRKFTHRRLS